MQQTTDHPTTTPESGLAAAALRAEAWAGEAFLHSEEDPEQVLAPGTARRRALDDALAEIEAGNRSPSPQWRVRYGLMLGLERVLNDPEPHLASGTTLRRHQMSHRLRKILHLPRIRRRPTIRSRRCSSPSRRSETRRPVRCLDCPTGRPAAAHRGSTSRR